MLDIFFIIFYPCLANFYPIYYDFHRFFSYFKSFVIPFLLKTSKKWTKIIENWKKYDKIE